MSGGRSPGREAGHVSRFDPKMGAQDASCAGLRWSHAWEEPFRLAGFPWFGEDRRYRRLPVNPPEPLPEAVDHLADCPAGGQVQFRTNSRRVAVAVKLFGPADMVHMPATGQCGFDLYVGPPGAKRYYGTTKYPVRAGEYDVLLFEDGEAEEREFTLNFPLYKGVKEVRIGLEPSAEVSPPSPYALSGRVVVYGTSITQGGCASRPGSAYTNILSRRLNVEFVNLGFSGSGKGEPEVARTVALIPDPLLFVLDYEANCPDPKRLGATLPEFIRILRAKHPDAPILVLSRIRSGQEHLKEQVEKARIERLRIQEETVEELRRAGDGKVFFLDGSGLLGKDWDECTVDGSHPTDLGFMRMADALEPEFRRLLDL